MQFCSSKRSKPYPLLNIIVHSYPMLNTENEYDSGLCEVGDVG